MTSKKLSVMYKVKLSESAIKFYSKCDKNVAKKLNRCFETLKIDPYSSNNVKKLTGDLKDYFRFRLGDYRVIYKIDEATKQVVIRTIEHRSNIYKTN